MTDEQREAVEWVVEFIASHISEDEADDVDEAEEMIRRIRTLGRGKKCQK